LRQTARYNGILTISKTIEILVKLNFESQAKNILVQNRIQKKRHDAKVAKQEDEK